MGISFVSPTCLCMISLIVLKRRRRKNNNNNEKQKNQNTIIWLQACFLVDVKVIWCNSLGDSHFQTNVIENVEHLITFCLHITYFVFCTLTSCTHYMQINVEFCTCDCVCYLIWPSLITYELIWKYNFLDQGGIWRKILLEVLNQVILLLVWVLIVKIFLKSFGSVHVHLIS